MAHQSWNYSDEKDGMIYGQNFMNTIVNFRVLQKHANTL
jgi:hypothetical protein